MPDFGLKENLLERVAAIMRGQGWKIDCPYNQETDERPGCTSPTSSRSATPTSWRGRSAAAWPQAVPVATARTASMRYQ
jgi:hypothetical protein